MLAEEAAAQRAANENWAAANVQIKQLKAKHAKEVEVLK